MEHTIMTKRTTRLSQGILLSTFMLFAVGAAFAGTTAKIPVGMSAADPYSQGYDHAYRGDYRAAFSDWMPAAKAGDARAQFNLALLYHGGLLGPVDEAMAVHWYREAAKNGIREAQEYLAAAYREGWFGLSRNPNLARYWEEQLRSNQSF